MKSGSAKGQKTSDMMDIFFILTVMTVMTVSRFYTYVKTFQIAYFKYVQFFVCRLYLYKTF